MPTDIITTKKVNAFRVFSLIFAPFWQLLLLLLLLYTSFTTSEMDAILVEQQNVLKSQTYLVIMVKVLLPTLHLRSFSQAKKKQRRNRRRRKVCYRTSEKSVQKKEIIHAVTERPKDGGLKKELAHTTTPSQRTVRIHVYEICMYVHIIFYVHKLTRIEINWRNPCGAPIKHIDNENDEGVIFAVLWAHSIVYFALFVSEHSAFIFAIVSVASQLASQLALNFMIHRYCH